MRFLVKGSSTGWSELSHFFRQFMVVFDFLCAFVQRLLKCCSVIAKIIVRVTFNGWIWTDSTGVGINKMKGAHNRYLAEFATGETKSKAGENACVACAEVTKIAKKILVMTHLVRLVIALSSYVFQYEVLQNPNDIASGVHVGGNDLDDVPVVTQKQIPMVQRTRTLQSMDKVVDNLVVQVQRMQVVRKQSRSHSCRPLRNPLRLHSPRRFRALKPLRVWALHLSVKSNRREMWSWSRSERLFLQNPHHTRSSQRQFRRLWRNWLRPSRFSLRTGFNSVLENRRSKHLLFHSMGKSLRRLSLGRIKRRNRL